jgi:hypothetical protein
MESMDCSVTTHILTCNSAACRVQESITPPQTAVAASYPPRSVSTSPNSVANSKLCPSTNRPDYPIIPFTLEHFNAHSTSLTTVPLTPPVTKRELESIVQKLCQKRPLSVKRSPHYPPRDPNPKTPHGNKSTGTCIENETWEL